MRKKSAVHLKRMVDWYNKDCGYCRVLVSRIHIRVKTGLPAARGNRYDAIDRLGHFLGRPLAFHPAIASRARKGTFKNWRFLEVP